MPELPDLVHVEAELRRLVVGHRITAARTGDPTVLRIMVPEPFPAAVVGRTVEDAARRGHFIRFGLSGDLVLVVNAMLVGRFAFLPSSAPRPGRDPAGLALALTLDDGGELRYLDEKRMGKVYVARTAAEGEIPTYRELGLDVLSDAFTSDAFRRLLRSRRDQVRVFLMDKRALASIGNAYADEILFAARIHPKTFCKKLADEEIGTLHRAIGEILRAAVDEIARRDEPMDVKVRDFLSVRGRAGQPCPRCRTVIRKVRVGDWDACFCPTCQPPSRRMFVDWRKLGSPDPDR